MFHDMNIGVDIRPLMDSARTGVGEYTYEFLNALFKIDSQNQYFLFYNSAKDVSSNIPKWPQDNVHFIETKYPNKFFNLAMLFLKWPKLDKLIVKKSNINNLKLDYFLATNLNFLALSKKVKYIFTIYDLSFEFFPDCFCFKRRLWHKILAPKKQCQKADIILTPSENTKRDVVNKYKINPEKIKVLYPGLSSVFNSEKSVNIDEVKKKYNLPPKFVLFLGTVEPRKNIIGLIEAYKKSKILDDLCSLVIVGAKGWNTESIMEKIQNTPGVKYIGYIEAQDKPTLYSLAELFIFPSLYEGFGFPVLEAIASGTAVITSNRSSLPEVAGSASYLVNPNNTDEIARGIKLLYKNLEIRKLLIEKGKENISKFNWHTTAEQFLQIII